MAILPTHSIRYHSVPLAAKLRDTAEVSYRGKITLKTDVNNIKRKTMESREGWGTREIEETDCPRNSENTANDVFVAVAVRRRVVTVEVV